VEAVIKTQQIVHGIGAMLECALWSSYDDQGESLLAGRGIQDIHPSATRPMIGDFQSFVTANSADIEASGLNPRQVGQDFWLTRNGHGTGFWDRGLGTIGDRLTAAAKAYGPFDLYVGDDSGVYGQ
jgi:hypothetical protein